MTPENDPENELRNEHEDGICQHFQRAADLLGKRWSTLIVSAMLAGVTRFSDIRDAVAPISDTLLSERLKQLEVDGIVHREVTPSTPVLIQYHLTEEGRDLKRVIDELRRWSERWAEEPVAR
jgi:DNA-binding HxlR family transcriptional regulator